MIEYNDYFQLKNPLTCWKSKVSYKARQKMFSHFMEIVSPTEKSSILDVGVTPDTSLPESNFFEKWYPWTHNIVITSIEDASNLEKEFKGVKFVRTIPGAAFPFDDKQFDILFCSAVLEHVGDDEIQKQFVHECIRVAKKIYLTTPNRHFPIEFHTYLPFVHYLPRNIHQKILRVFKMNFFAETSNLNLLTRKKLLSTVPESARKNTVIYYNYLLGGGVLSLGIATNLILYIET